jgi:hypothetical protein
VALSLGVKRQGREADHSSPFSTDVKTFTTPYVFEVWCTDITLTLIGETRGWEDNIKMDLRQDGVIRTGFIWLGIGTNGGFL